jgi:superfamily II DNA or RNA helicase
MSEDHNHLEEAIAKFGGFRKDYSWQEQSIETFMGQLTTFYSSTRGQFQRAYINEVSPSGGKTIFSMKLARRMITDGLIDRVIWCVPRDSIKIGFGDDTQKVEMPETHRLIRSRFIRIDTELRSSYHGALPNYHGMVITYQALPGLLSYFDLLASKFRLMFIFDESHHGSVTEGDAVMNIWGAAMEKCRSFANAIVCMTGTPLRSDAKKIPFVRYTDVRGDDGRTGWQVEPDYSFSYQKAVTAGIARKIICRSQDPEITYDAEESAGEIVRYRKPVSAIPVAHMNKVKNTAFCFDRGVVDDLLKIAHEECRLLRNTGDPDAAILVIGRRNTNQADNNSLDKIRERIQALFGDTATTVESADGSIAREAIKKFKYDTDQWIVAKEMISEGTNIPRLRIAVILRDIGNRTFYEQLVHRVTRNDADDRPQDAIIVQLHLPHLHEWGSDLERQALIGWNKRVQERAEQAEGSGSTSSQKYIEGISADLADETVVIEGEDFTTEDPIGRRLHDLIGGETKTSRWQLDKILKVLPNVGVSLDTATAPINGDELFSIEEQFTRHSERALKWCKTAARNIGGENAYAKVIAECKRSAGIRGKLSNVIRDHKKPIDAIKTFEAAAYRILQNSKSDAGQGALL